MRLLLDTVTFLWATSDPTRLSRAARSALQKNAAVRELSVISIAEIAHKQTRGKLSFSDVDAKVGIADLRLRLLPYTGDHAFRLFELPIHHPDPFDRQIIAQALVEGIPIVTPDEAFQRYKELRVIW